MSTALGVLAILVLFFVVPFVLVVTFATARARRELRDEDRPDDASPA